jgi:hypothetical protein
MADKKTEDASTQKQDVKVFISESVRIGVFSNTTFISHNSEEFTIDFLSMTPRGGSVVARIFLTTSHTRRLVAALAENVKKYEEKFGQIPIEIKEKK